MAKRPLGLVVHFGHGACAGGQIKERIVSETVTTTRSGENAAFGRALRGQQSVAIAGSSQRTLIASAALTLRDASELQQQEEIDHLNKKLNGFHIFKGIESDILYDGSLDYPDEILKRFDFIVASVHSILKMEEEKANLQELK